MKTFIKVIKTTIAVFSILFGLTAFFTLDNGQSITTLIIQVFFMILGVVVGIHLLISIYPELSDLSEFDEDNNSIFDEYDREIEELREHNLLLLDRYITFKSILKSNNVINDKNKENYPNIYHLIYEEDLVSGKTTIKEGSLEQIDRFKEIYN